jgi:hypothetical protein
MHRIFEKILNNAEPFKNYFKKDYENLYLLDNNGYVRVIAKTTPILEIFTTDKLYTIRTALGKSFKNENYSLKSNLAKSIFFNSYNLLNKFIQLQTNSKVLNWGKEIFINNDYFKEISYYKNNIINKKKVDLDLIVDMVNSILFFIIGKMEKNSTVYLEHTDSIKYFLVTDYEVLPAFKFRISNNKLKSI